MHAVVTGSEAAELCDPLPDFGAEPARHTWRCLAADKVRYVGEGVAVAVAESRYIAEDALELIEVEYEPLPRRGRPGARRWPPGAPLVHEALGANFAYERTFDFGEVERDFAEADSSSPTACAGPARAASRWRPSGPSPTTTPAPAASRSTPTR